MTSGITGIIAQLERQKAAIERALAALREIDGIAGQPAHSTAKKTADISAEVKAGHRPGKSRKFSAAARKKMALAQQTRWAKIKGEDGAPSVDASELPKPKRKISPEGMKRIIAATKKRWRLQRAAAKSGGTKTVSPK